jgi:flavin reductase (NADH)
VEHRPIQADIRSGPSEPDPSAPFRDAMARWASGVSVVAVRDPDDERVYATTVSSLSSVSADPPRIVLSLGPGAQVVPFLKPGRTFVVNGLNRSQRQLAVRYTDAFPVGTSPFSEEGAPVIEGSDFSLVCAVEQVVPVDASRLVVATVSEVRLGDDPDPLVHHMRGYRSLA